MPNLLGHGTFIFDSDLSLDHVFKSVDAISHSIYRLFRCMDRAVVSIDRIGQSIDDDDNSLDEAGRFIERVVVSTYRVFNPVDEIGHFIFDGGKCVDEADEPTEPPDRP